MKISELQAQLLVRVLEGSLGIADERDAPRFGVRHEQRCQLYEALMNQQSTDLVELDEDK